MEFAAQAAVSGLLRVQPRVEHTIQTGITCIQVSVLDLH